MCHRENNFSGREFYNGFRKNDITIIFLFSTKIVNLTSPQKISACTTDRHWSLSTASARVVKIKMEELCSVKKKVICRKMYQIEPHPLTVTFNCIFNPKIEKVLRFTNRNTSLSYFGFKFLKLLILVGSSVNCNYQNNHNLWPSELCVS